MSKSYEYLFGPVPSRRLGRSLGIDLIPFKTCTLDCTYCQLGATTCDTSVRGNYVPMRDVLAELDRWKAEDGRADHITLAGSGEPTLHARFGEVFGWVKAHTAIRSVLLTNGTLLHDPDVRAQAALADKVKVTLSAWDEASFQRIHRPARGITFERLVAGERAFRAEFSGELSVEVFIIDGINSNPDDARRIAEVVETIHPDRIDLNTAVRPPTVKTVAAVAEDRMEELAALFGPRASVAATYKRQGFISHELDADALLGLIKRHPSTCAQLAAEFNLPIDVLLKRLTELVAAGQLLADRCAGETYYFVR